ncbi:phosphohydrolase [Neoasaia chiangmaiensis NBRC 101099]|uniref:Uncharacterized protein n=1 Tax=Neoasaia chiangmaiensis TaxID=320497 RepID=A0A1U9KRF4_9PROT|nr:hypothetical protein [Neoasaia chiangmaiensis]AQS88327.1 hypothetical protein A0U93_10665 [Neoasaia chiangmaiensis]GBR39531.1 phosphohydrolase [Neoasaia chiangmaiensis NBRC 101099]GEN14625.1 hypothetical protein NCH01_10560 [Neoasaia chiangmaiensis]
MMAATEWPVVELHPDVSVATLDDSPALDADTAAHVAALWERACATRPSLYNGRVFCATEIAPDRIAGRWTEYRLALAQMLDPDLFEVLQLRPLAVNGLMRTPDGIVLGRRAAKAIYQPDLRQSVPAGSIESRNGDRPVDLAAQLAAEIEEELGLSARDVVIHAPLLTCEHPGTHIVDIGIPFDCALPFATIHDIWQRHGNDEYDALECIAHPLSLHDATDVVPTTRAMIGRLTP